MTLAALNENTNNTRNMAQKETSKKTQKARARKTASKTVVTIGIPNTAALQIPRNSQNQGNTQIHSATVPQRIQTRRMTLAGATSSNDDILRAIVLPPKKKKQTPKKLN